MIHIALTRKCDNTVYIHLQYKIAIQPLIVNIYFNFRRALALDQML